LSGYVLIGVGLDLIDLDRFRQFYGRDDPDLLARCFTPSELAAAGQDVDRLDRLAARFAAKEATFKALGGAVGVALTDIEVETGENGPSLRLHGAALDLAAQRGVTQLLLSLTHSMTAAAAVVVASTGPK
jgi:holo-[acyl-carrier protein] synthase